jgi:hypothetical protein
VDALHAGTLNDSQRETVRALRASILALAEGGNRSSHRQSDKDESACYTARTQGRRERAAACPVALFRFLFHFVCPVRRGRFPPEKSGGKRGAWSAHVSNR